VVGYKKGDKKRNIMLEVKDGAKAKSARLLTRKEIEWHMDWTGEVYIVESVEQALDVVLNGPK
jgi:hypothetical protein